VPQIINIASDTAQLVHKTFMSDGAAWYYSDATCNHGGGKMSLETTIDTPQFCHYLYYDGEVLSEYLPIASKIIDALEMATQTKYANRMARVKANLIYKDPTYPKGFHHTAHIDSFDEGAETFLYYVNSTNAGTYFFDESGNGVKETVDCVEGSGVLFSSSAYHAGSTPTDALRRVVLNFVFSPKE
jgi:hypothetical protein